MSQEKTTVAEQAPEQTKKTRKGDIPRGVIAEWTVTIILLLFGTTTLVQAFVVPAPPLKLSSAGSQAMSPAAARTGSA